MLNSDTYRVEEHQDDDEPVEPLGFHCVSDPKPEPFLSAPEVCALAHGSRLALQETCGNQHSISITYYKKT